MTLKGKQRIVVRHAMTIVDHADHALAAGFDFDANRIRAGIERIFEQLFDYASRALDDFASRNAVGNSFRQMRIRDIFRSTCASLSWHRQSNRHLMRRLPDFTSPRTHEA